MVIVDNGRIGVVEKHIVRGYYLIGGMTVHAKNLKPYKKIAIERRKDK